MPIRVEILFCLVATFFVWPIQAWGQPEITAGAAALMDVDNGVIYFAKNGTQRRDPASLTKIMTCILALELADPEQEVEVSRRAAAVSVGSIIDLHHGERIKLCELVKAALVCSANDATVAIAEGVAGDHDTFVQWMNAKAVVLGMPKTRYANTNGYTHSGHYTTAADLATLTRYALKNPSFATLVRTRETTVHWSIPPRTVHIRNTNQLLRSNFPGITGVKTGTTDAAGKCLIASAYREGRKLISVVLHSNNRYGDASQLLLWGPKAIATDTVCRRGEDFTRLRVKEGRLPDVPLVADRDVVVSLPRSEQGLVQKIVSLFPAPEAPVPVGRRLGEVVFSWQGQEIGRVGLVAGKMVERRPWYWLRPPY